MHYCKAIYTKKFNDKCKNEYYFGGEKKNLITKIIKIIVIAYWGWGTYAY